MAKILFINACNSATSYTHQVASTFIDEYSKRNVLDEIIIRNLYEENIQFLDVKKIKEREKMSFRLDGEDEIFELVREFMNADKIVIAAPFWNLTIPAILHAYLEHIAIDGITYNLTNKGTIGLCQGKKIVHVVARGIYSSRIEYGDSYLRAFFASLGIKDFRTIALEGMKVHVGQEKMFLERSMKQAKSLAEVW